MEQITLDLIPSGILPVVHASQYDEGRQWRVNLTDNGTAYTLSTEEITLKVRKGDGTAVTTAVTVVSGKTYVDLATTEQMTAVAFENMAELHIEKDGAHIGTLNFIIKVEPDNLYGDRKSHTEIHDLAHQVDECVTAELKTVGAKLTGYDNTESGLDATNVQDALDELAQKPSVDAYTKQESDAFITDEYDAESTYAIGDMVIHENALYVCSTAITTAEAWNSAHWTLTDIATAIGTVKTAIPTKTSDLQNDSGFAQIDDTQVSASKTYSSEKIESELQNKYELVTSIDLQVNNSIIDENTNVTLDSVTGNYVSGYTFTTTSGSVEFNQTSENNKLYLLEFTMTNFAQNKIFVAFGSDEPADVYYGNANTQIVLKGNGGNLKITNKAYATKITNVKCYPIVDSSETTKTLTLGTVINMPSATSGVWNVILGGNRAFEKNINGTRNVGIGGSVLMELVSGTRNIAIGSFALNKIKTGDYNVAVGSDSLYNSTKALDCIAIGFGSMSGVGTEIEHNIAIGQGSMSGVTTGKNNIAIGQGSMGNPTSASASTNTYVGVESGYYGKSYNTAIGYRAGYYSKGSSNVFVGYGAGAVMNTTGDRNCFVGGDAGIDNTGATSENPKTVNNSIALGRRARVTKDFQMMLGSSDVTEVVFCGNKKINFNNDGTVTWETLT